MSKSKVSHRELKNNKKIRDKVSKNYEYSSSNRSVIMTHTFRVIASEIEDSMLNSGRQTS